MELIGIKTAAKRRNVSIGTIRYWIRMGKLKPVTEDAKIFKVSDVDKVVISKVGRKKAIAAPQAPIGNDRPFKLEDGDFYED